MINQLTVIPEDGVIIVDGEPLFFPFSAPAGMRAFQWHNGAGHIEYSNGMPNRKIGPDDFEADGLPFVSLWHAEKNRLEEEKKREPSMEEQRDEFISAIQLYLDSFAWTRNYDNILSAASYATSKNPRFAAEGQYAVELRDAVWAKGYEILEQVMSGARPLPSMEEVLAELPKPAWPEVAA